MRRSQINFWIDTLTLLVMLSLLVTGWILRYTLPPGSGGGGRGAAWTLWGWGRHQWGDLHFWLAIGTVGLLLVHVVLHWGWLCAMTQSLLPKANSDQRRFGTAARSIIGAAMLLLLTGSFGLFAWLAETQVRRPAVAQPGSDRSSALAGAVVPHEAQQEEQPIRGSMTLGEVAAASRVSIENLRQRLGLPDSISAQERIGRLRRGYGLDVSDVRAAVIDLRPR